MKKSLALILALALCMALCACGTCNCGCCQKAAEETVVIETVPEETMSPEEKLTELLVSEDWMDPYDSNGRYTFLRNGYGLYDEAGDHDDGFWFRWVLDGNKLLVMVEPGVDSTNAYSDDYNWNDLYSFDEEQGVFVQKLYDYSIHNYVEECRLIPESRISEFD